MAEPPQRPPRFNFYGNFIVDRCKGRLLDPQREALQELQKFFEQNPGGRIGLVSMPTGSGKTGVISCLPYFLGKLSNSVFLFDKPVLVIAPDLTIAKQLEEELLVSPNAPGENFLVKREIVPNDQRYQRDIVPNGAKIEEAKHVINSEFLTSNEVIIANAQKFLRDDWENVLPDDIFKLVIVDEAHHHPARTWRRIIEKFRNHSMVAFFTATPYRADGQRVVDDEEGQLVYHLSLEDARTMRIIRRIKWDPLHSEDTELGNIFKLILERVKSIQQAKDDENPLPDSIPHMAIAITPNNIAYAEQVAEIWNNHWGNFGGAIAYHSQVHKRPKLAMMEALRSNNIKLVVIVKKLLEGFDHPPISIAAIMTKIKSRVKFAQFLGRAQRVVRFQGRLESAEIFADVVTHSFFEQELNYQAYEEALLIPDD